MAGFAEGGVKQKTKPQKQRTARGRRKRPNPAYKGLTFDQNLRTVAAVCEAITAAIRLFLPRTGMGEFIGTRFLTPADSRDVAELNRMYSLGEEVGTGPEGAD